MTIEELKKEYECKLNALNEEFNNKIAELQESKKESNKRWKPEEGEKYYYISATGIVKVEIYKNDYFSNRYYDFHNMFKTYEEAKFAAERWKVIRELEMLADDDIVWSEELCGDDIHYMVMSSVLIEHNHFTLNQKNQFKKP